MSRLAEAFIHFMVHQFIHERNVFIVVDKIRRIFNCDITPACVRGWYRLFYLDSRILEYNNNRFLNIRSKTLKEWYVPSNMFLITMCKELISYRKDLELDIQIGKTLYDEIWISYTENSYKFERRYEMNVEDTRNKLFVQVWWETSSVGSFMSQSVENITIDNFCNAIKESRLSSALINQNTIVKHIFIIDSRNPLLSEIREELGPDYNILALPPNFSDISPMNHPFDNLYYQFHEFLKENRYSQLEIIVPAFKQFHLQNLDLFNSVFDDFYTCCILYMKMH